MTEIDADVSMTEDDVASMLPGQTSYVVQWTVVGDGAFKTPSTAIRETVDKLGQSLEGTFVAVPSRSWRPVTVKAKVTTTLVLEDAK